MAKSTPKPKTREKFKINTAKQVLRMYLALEDHFTQYGNFTLERDGLEINFLDLKGVLEGLAPHLNRAVYYNVILDMMQKEAAVEMGVAPTSVSLYVNDACKQVARRLWDEG